MKSPKSNASSFESMFLDDDSLNFQHGGVRFITYEAETRKGILWVEQLMEKLAKGDEQLFDVEYTVGKEPQLLITELGNEFLACVECLDKLDIQYHYPSSVCELSPLYAIFDRYVGIFLVGYDFIRNDNVDKYNQLVRCLRQAVRSQQFKKRKDYWGRNMRTRTHESLSYVRDISCTYAKVLVIRLDVHYGAAFALHGARREPVNFEETLQHRAQFINYIKKNYPVLGYISKTEYGSVKSFHHHILLFLDGQKVRKDITIAQALGEHWVNEITKGRGTYWNCNARKRNYRKLAIGMLYHKDVDKWDQLEVVVKYFCKIDHYIRVKIPKGKKVHLLIKGQSPIKKREKKMRRGRPRFPTSKMPMQEAMMKMIRGEIKPNKPWMAHAALNGIAGSPGHE